jgi:hypothetical protein
MTPKPSKKPAKGLAAEERSAIQARVKELRSPKGGGEAVALAAIAKMPGPYRGLGERLHKIVMESAPGLEAKTWYGLPAYAKDGKVVCYMRMNPKSPFNDRYLTFGFNETAKLDEDTMWPIAFAVTKLGAADEAKVRTLVKKAVA